MDYANNREHVLALISEGGYTRKALCEAVNIKPASLATVFTQLRLMGHYPMENEDKTLRIGTKDEWDAFTANRATAAKREPRTPQEAYCMAAKREGRAASKSSKADKAYEADPSKENELRKALADAEYNLAAYLVELAEAKLEEAGISLADVDCDDQNSGADDSDGIEPEEQEFEVPGSGDEESELG